MSYYATGSGSFTLKSLTEGEAQELIQKVNEWSDSHGIGELNAPRSSKAVEFVSVTIRRLLLSCFSVDVYRVPYYWPQFNTFDLVFDGNYHEDDIYERLEIIRPYLEKLVICFEGEDADHWRIRLTDNGFVEDVGTLTYSPFGVLTPEQKNLMGQMLAACIPENDTEEQALNELRSAFSELRG